jgi:DNA-dependent RNA polymerase auxiliary subunit epsilon
MSHPTKRKLNLSSAQETNKRQNLTSDELKIKWISLIENKQTSIEKSHENGNNELHQTIL